MARPQRAATRSVVRLGPRSGRAAVARGGQGGTPDTGGAPALFRRAVLEPALGAAVEALGRPDEATTDLARGRSAQDAVRAVEAGKRRDRPHGRRRREAAHRTRVDPRETGAEPTAGDRDLRAAHPAHALLLLLAERAVAVRTAAHAVEKADEAVPGLAVPGDAGRVGAKHHASRRTDPDAAAPRLLDVGVREPKRAPTRVFDRDRLAGDGGNRRVP